MSDHYNLQGKRFFNVYYKRKSWLKCFKQNNTPYFNPISSNAETKKKRRGKILRPRFTIGSLPGFLDILPQGSVLAPSVTTCHALEETRHRLISTSNLHLEERRLLAGASFIRALRLGLLRVVPGSRTAKDVLALLALKDTAREDRVGDGVFVRACATLEAICAVERQGDGQDICAMRADCVTREKLWSDRKNEMLRWIWNHVLTEKHGCGYDCIML